MILFTTLLFVLLAILAVILAGSAGFLVVFADVFVCIGLIVLIVKLFTGKRKSS